MSFQASENPELEKLVWLKGERILFFGIGNIGRRDDGLGGRLIEKLEELRALNCTDWPEEIALDANYQLNAEDALLISGYDVVVFIDATVTTGSGAPFLVESFSPSSEITFSTHAMSMGSVLAFSEELYGKKPRTYLMTLPGYEWDISDELSEGANKNLNQTFEAIYRKIRNYNASYKGC